TELVDSEATIGAEMRLIAAARGQADATEPEPGAFDDLMGRLRGMLERLRVPGSEPNLGPLLDAARGGDRRILVARAEDGTLGMYIALPVFAGADPVGAVLLSTQGGDIDRLVSRQRAQTVAAVSLSLLVATVLSIILARSIARPLRLLAAAAERTGGTGRDPSRAKIPDFDDRPDEIGYLTRTLRSMTETLFDRLEVNEAFAADVSHEIKNPLTSLRSAVETMGYAKTDEQRARLLAIIENDVKRLDRLVTDISNASRLDTELVREEAEPFDMARLCDSLVDHARAPAEKRGVALAVSGTREETFMNGLEGRLAQVISNLLSNAVSFSPEGSTVRLRLSSTPEAIRIAVEDEGPGIPDANLEDVFERFYSERPGQEFGSHSGLGLAISRQIVEAHRGTIRAENRRPAGAGLDTPPQGARFVVELPR
ncbi:MAG: sensor histidine kinase, partial [Rubricella sp.]